MTPVITLPAQKADSRKLVLFYRDEDGKVRDHHLDDSETAHPGGEVRMINLGPYNLAASIGNHQEVVPPGESRLLGAPRVDDQRVMTFEFAVSRPGQTPFRSPVTRLRLRSDRHRLLVVYTFMPTFSTTNGRGGQVSFTPIAYNLFDRIQPKSEEKPPPKNS
jgi:hypothetical protein